tara:strand:+ start:1265 stop:5461 length:4197 start_codon:yes stop_codon:yes gene_type:complete
MYTHIIHIADIHIRTNRTDEYLSIFNNLFQSIKDITDNPLIVICGDVIHERSHLTPEVIKKTLYFFENLGKLGKCILINGNHDFSENNLIREKFLDVLPKPDAIDYLTQSGEYLYDNVLIGIASLDDKGFTYHKDLKHSNKNDLTSIALGHYTLDEVSPFIKGQYAVKDHEGYDFALLGDIHARNKYGSNCYYSGSLIQQNYGETMEKGIGLIDLKTKTYKFVDIANDYGFVTINTYEGNLILPKSFPKFTNIRIRRDIQYQSKDIEYETQLNKLTNVLSIKTVTTITTIDQQQVIDEEIDHTYDDMSIMNKILGDHPSKDALLELHKNYRRDTNVAIKGDTNFYLKRLEFENIMSYKNKCLIDFERLQGIIGIHGVNASGKSNILRAIVFSLCGDISVDYAGVDEYGRKSKTSMSQFSVKYSYNNSCVLNKSTDKGYTEVIFVHGSHEYKVRRELSKKKDDKVENKVALYQLFDDRWRSITETVKKDTDLFIHKMVGRSPLFMLMNVYNRDATSIVNCTARERYNIIASLFDTEMFETINNKVCEEVKKLRQEKAKFDGQLEYIRKDELDLSEEIDTKLLDDETVKLKKDIETLKLCYTSDINPNNTLLDQTVKDLYDTAKKLRKSLKLAESRILEDIPEGESLKISRTVYDSVIDRYCQLKHSLPITQELPEIDDLPEPYKTGITEEDLIAVRQEIAAYNYDDGDISCHTTRDKLVRILNYHNQEYAYTSSSIPKSLNFPFPSLDVFNIKLPKIVMLSKDVITLFIKKYEDDVLDLDKLKNELDKLNVPIIKIIHTVKELVELCSRYPEDSTFDKHPEITKLITSKEPSPIDIDKQQKEIDSIEIPEKLPLSRVKVSHTMKELVKLCSRYPKDSIFDRTSQIKEPKTLPKTIMNINKLQSKIDITIVQPLYHIKSLRKINNNMEVLQREADEVLDIDKIVKALIEGGTTPANIKLVSDIKLLLPKISDIYKSINSLRKDIDHNKKIDEDKAFNLIQEKELTKLNNLKSELNDELYMRNKHMDYLEEIEALKIIIHNKTVDEMVSKLNKLTSELNDELYMRTQHMNYLEEIEAHELVKRKNEVQKKITQAIEDTVTYNKYVDILKDIKYKEYYDQNIAVHFQEISRRIAYIDTLDKYNNVHHKYKQNIAYLINEKNNYDTLMLNLKYIRYYNNIYRETIHANTTTLANINATVNTITDINNNRLKEIEDLKYRSLKILDAKNIKCDIHKLLDELTLKETYQSFLTKHGGIKEYVLNKYISQVQKNINKHLSNYHITLVQGDKNTLNLLVHKNTLTLLPQQLSGFESFALELASKRVLTHFSTVGTSQFLAIDEGFDVIDQSNLEQFQQNLYDMLGHYRHIILISHNETIKNMTQHILTPQSIHNGESTSTYKKKTKK